MSDLGSKRKVPSFESIIQQAGHSYTDPEFRGTEPMVLGTDPASSKGRHVDEAGDSLKEYVKTILQPGTSQQAQSEHIESSEMRKLASSLESRETSDKIEISVEDGQPVLMYACSLCDSSIAFLSKSELVEHRKSHAADEFECQICNVKFPCLGDLEVHMCGHQQNMFIVKHENTKNIASSTSQGQGSPGNGQKLPNQSVKRPGDPIQGQVMPDKVQHLLSGSQYLVSDTRVPLELLPQLHKKPGFKCHVCGKVYSTKGNHMKHMFLHNGLKPFKCDQCDKCFSIKGNRDKHMLTHTDTRPHKCEICDRTFSLKGNLNQHMLTHRKDKWFQCSVCDREFTLKGNLIKHLERHKHQQESQQVYQCAVCDKEFSLKGNLLKHLARHRRHEESDDEEEMFVPDELDTPQAKTTPTMIRQHIKSEKIEANLLEK